MKIEIEKYLEASEIEDIIKQNLSDEIKKIIKDNERVLSNEAYRIVEKMVDESLNGELTTIIQGKVKDIVSDLSSYSVFRGPTSWDKSESAGYRIVEDEVRRREKDIRKIISNKVSNQLTRIESEENHGTS